MYLKIALGAAFVISVLLFVFTIPDIARDIVAVRPEYAYLYTPCMILMWVSAMPVYVAMFKAWFIFTDIGNGLSYTYANAKRLQDISRLIMADIILWAMCLLVLIFVKMSHPAMFLLFMTLFFICIIAGVITSALSHLVFRYCNEHGERRAEEQD